MQISLSQLILKHLPPSAERLRLLDVNGEASPDLLRIRPEIDCLVMSGDARTWTIPPDSVDAVVALDYIINDAFLSAALSALRVGGRLIIIHQQGGMGTQESFGRRLEDADYVRILVESLPEGGVLMRGEKRHDVADTLARIQTIASQDADRMTLTNFKGRYVHLLIQQTPNKPVWRLDPDEPICWQALALQRGTDLALLAFSSLPKAVNFMQPAVLNGHISDINKVGKFRRDYAPTWALPVIVNPSQDVFESATVTWVEVDPALAETPDE